MLALDVPDALTHCAAMPAHPCPEVEHAGPDTPAAAPAPLTLWQRLTGMKLPEGVQPTAEGQVTPPPRVCPEKSRWRWEAMLVNWGRDCESKLAATRKVIKEQVKSVNSRNNR